jgi:hypothetical protein
MAIPGPQKVPLLSGWSASNQSSILIKQDFRYIEYIQDVLISIHENLRELNERKNFADPEELPHIEGKIVAYQEMLSILRMSADSFGLSKHELGL